MRHFWHHESQPGHRTAWQTVLSVIVIRSLHHHKGHMQIDNTAARATSTASPKTWPVDDGNNYILFGNASHWLFSPSVRFTVLSVHLAWYRDHCRAVARGWEFAEYQRQHMQISRPRNVRHPPTFRCCLCWSAVVGNNTFSNMCAHARCFAKCQWTYYEINGFIVWSWKWRFLCLCIHNIYPQ